jgi:hypothetical protein
MTGLLPTQQLHLDEQTSFSNAVVQGYQSWAAREQVMKTVV